jgi:CspA family cold shock protein
MTERRAGLVKAWRDEKGFGFIAPYAGGKDVFVHFSYVQGQEHLQRGDRVAFVLGFNKTNGKTEGEGSRAD